MIPAFLLRELLGGAGTAGKGGTPGSGTLLLDTETRLTMGKKARERAQSFDWQRSAEAFERLLMDQEAQRLP